MKGIKAILIQRSSIIPLALLRILVGLLAFLDIVGQYIVYYLQKEVLTPGAFHFHYYGFKWVEIPPEPYWTIIFLIGALSAIAVCLGYRYRWASVLLFICFSYIFLAEKCLYLNHGYLFIMLSFWMIWMPAHRLLSFDVKQGRIDASFYTIHAYRVLLCFMMAMVYFYGGIAKINGDWLRAVPMLQWMAGRADYPLIGKIISQDWFAWFLSYGGLVFDLSISFFLLSRRTRKYAIYFVISFHLLNTVIFKIGIFPWLSIGMSLLFFSDAFFERIYHNIKIRFANITEFNTLFLRPRHQEVLCLAIALYFIIMMILPLRHHFIEGNVAWTEEGHRCSWRMMLRGKSGYGTFRVVNAKGKVIVVQPRDHIPYRQLKKLYGHPDMILEFAHYLGDMYSDSTGRAEVYAQIFTKLNDRSYQRYIDPNVNLDTVKWSPLYHSEWVLPLRE